MAPSKHGQRCVRVRTKACGSVVVAILLAEAVACELVRSGHYVATGSATCRRQRLPKINENQESWFTKSR